MTSLYRLAPVLCVLTVVFTFGLVNGSGADRSLNHEVARDHDVRLEAEID